MPYDAYPQVSAIGGKRINPDIDILQVQKVSQTQSRLVGYEVKLIKFDSRSKGLSWSAFYNGIGQALLYLKNGVHRAVLVLGFHESVPDDNLIDQFHKWLWDNKDLLKRILGNCLSIDLHLYQRSPISPLVDATSDFYALDEKVRLLSDEMLHKKFTFNKRLRVD